MQISLQLIWRVHTKWTFQSQTLGPTEPHLHANNITFQAVFVRSLKPSLNIKQGVSITPAKFLFQSHLEV